MVDATVVARSSIPTRPTRYTLRLAHGAELTVDLNDFNHCVQRFDSVSDFQAAISSFCTHLSRATEELEDAITGVKLRTADQLLNIEATSDRTTAAVGITTSGVKRAGYSDAPDIKALAPALLTPSESRAGGHHLAQPVLVAAGPGTGKTWSSVQVCRGLSTCAAKSTLPRDDTLTPPLSVFARDSSRTSSPRAAPSNKAASL